METQKDSFVFYRSFWEAIKDITPEYRQEIVETIIEYALNKKEPTELTPICRGYFTLIKPQLDSSHKKFMAGVNYGHLGAEHGQKGGRPKQITLSEPSANPQETLCKPTNSNYNSNLNYNSNSNLNYNNISPEQTSCSKQAVVKITFDIGKCEFIGITDNDIELWHEAYPAVNLNTELNAMAAWLKANPKNRKSNYPKFITNWLKRTQDRAGRVK